MTDLHEDILSHQRIAARELGTITRERSQRRPHDLDLTPRLERVRQAASQVRLGVERVAPPQAGEIETWLVTTEHQVNELGLLTEACELFRAEAEVEGYGAICFGDALDALERHLERDPVRAAQAWDGAQQLAPPLEDPRLAVLPEVAQALTRYRELAARVSAELAPRLASARVQPLVDAAQTILEALVRSTDDGEEEAVAARRAELRQALARIPRDGDVIPEVQALDTAAAAAFARSEAELGGHLVLNEIEKVERVVDPALEQVERALATKSAERAIEHAPRLRVGLPALAPFASHARVERLVQRARAALDRIAPELGADVARAVEEADAVPVIAIAPGTGTRVEAVLRKITKAFAEYRDAYLATQARFDDEIDLVNGTPSAPTDRVSDDVDRTAREMVRAARHAEELAGQLRTIDASHPAVTTVTAAVPALIRRVQDWKARLSPYFAYANAIDEARQSFERARDMSEAGADSPHQAKYLWPEVMQLLVTTEEHVATAAAALPADVELVAPWRAKITALRQHAISELAGVCVAEATRLATQNFMDQAQEFADALKDAVPEATENAQIAAMLAGTADARERAALEIETHGALIRRAAERAARNARHTYDSWVGERPSLVTLAGTIVTNIDLYRGRFIAGRCSHLGINLADEPATIRGDIYQVDYDPEVRRHLAEGMAHLDGMFASRAEQTAAAAGVAGLRTTTQHYPSDAYYHAEIVGVASYTPVHEVRDNYGNVLHTFTGIPYPVPRIVIRAVATTYFVIVPGEPPSLDAMTTDQEG